jgi:hypothetical protein
VNVPRATRRQWLFACALLAFGTLVYALVVIRDYSGPLVGGPDYDGLYRGDTNYFELLGYHVRDHWRFGLHPISFFTKDVAFPNGTHIGLLSWCAERDLFHAAMLGLFGAGPWIQVYLTLGVALGAVGVTAILAKEYGLTVASLVGFVASFMSFYAWYKYPYHLNICALHWVTMSIAADAVTMRRVVAGKRLTVPFIVLRAALLVLSMGLDLGYVTGHALTSFCVTVYFGWAYLGRRDKRIFGRLSLLFPEDPFGETRSLAFLGASALLAFGIVVYLPFVAAVVRDTATYPMQEAVGTYWANQAHALFPYLPGVHPNSKIVRAIFGADEGVGEYAPGFTLLVAGGIGIWLAHERDTMSVVQPLLVTAILVFAFHPRWCRTLQIFPWFAYNRVAGRGTVVLPILLALMAASVDDWPRLGKRVVALLGIAEFATAALLVSAYRPAKLEAKHEAYFEAISQTPGTAVLDWPFCIASATALITRELCPYYDRFSTAYAYRRFHHKATVGMYLSRLHPSQVATWVDDGWIDMFSPDDPKRLHPKHELRCFSEEQWARFDRLYRGSDFAGIQLYTDVLPNECVDAFHARYGTPRAAETLPRVGRVEFIPRVH